MDPGSGGGVFTGHSVLFLPARMALTSAILSFFVRFATEGTVMGGSFGVVSFATVLVVLAVLEAVVSVFTTGAADIGVDVGAARTFSVATAVVVSAGPPGGASIAGVARPSLLAAQAAKAGIRLKAHRSFLSLCRSITANCISEEAGVWWDTDCGPV
jgi:hypothetical protein